MPKQRLKNIRYVVMGKGCPRSVGFTTKSSARGYAYHFKTKGCKPRIYQIENEKLKERFMKRYHNTPGWRNKRKNK